MNDYSELREENERLRKACGSLDTHEALQARLSAAEERGNKMAQLAAERVQQLGRAEEVVEVAKHWSKGGPTASNPDYVERANRLRAAIRRYEDGEADRQTLAEGGHVPRGVV